MTQILHVITSPLVFVSKVLGKVSFAVSKKQCQLLGHDISLSFAQQKEDWIYYEHCLRCRKILNSGKCEV